MMRDEVNSKIKNRFPFRGAECKTVILARTVES